MPRLELDFQHNDADFHTFMRYNKAKGRSRRPWLWISLGLLILLINFFPGRAAWQNLDWVSVASVLVPIGLLVLVWPFLVRAAAKRYLQHTPQFFEKRHCVIDGDQLQLQGETFSTDYLWSGFQRVVETPELFLLYPNPISAVLLPKRAFTPEQLSDFYLIMREQPNLEVTLKN